MTKLLVTGTREGRADVEIWLDRYVKKYGKPEVLLVGCADGVDKQVREWAEPRVGLKVFYADWRRFGPGAGPERNSRMVVYCTAGDHCVAFPGVRSVGTYDCVRKARERGMKVWIAQNLMPNRIIESE